MPGGDRAGGAILGLWPTVLRLASHSGWWEVWVSSTLEGYSLHPCHAHGSQAVTDSLASILFPRVQELLLQTHFADGARDGGGGLKAESAMVWIQAYPLDQGFLQTTLEEEMRQWDGSQDGSHRVNDKTGIQHDRPIRAGGRELWLPGVCWSFPQTLGIGSAGWRVGVAPQGPGFPQLRTQLRVRRCTEGETETRCSRTQFQAH